MTKVMIGLSGGVDSAVAAYLLKKQGYEVIAGFMRNWDSMLNNDFLGNPNSDLDICPQEKDYNDAKKVADQLGIELYRIDFVKEYWDNVFTYFLLLILPSELLLFKIIQLLLYVIKYQCQNTNKC